jgi:hypothetical protein
MERRSRVEDDDSVVDVGRGWWWPIAVILALGLLGFFADWFFRY